MSDNSEDKQTASSLNNFNKPFKPHYIKSDSYNRKYGMNADYFDRYGAYSTNPIVQSNKITEMGVPIPSEENTEQAREFNEEHKT